MLICKKTRIESHRTPNGCEGCKAGSRKDGKPEIMLVELMFYRKVDDQLGGYTGVRGLGLTALCERCLTKMTIDLFPSMIGAALFGDAAHNPPPIPEPMPAPEPVPEQSPEPSPEPTPGPKTEMYREVMARVKKRRR